MPAPHSFLTIHVEHQRYAYVISVEGELDLPGCVDLEAALGEAERTQASRIILDLEELTFIDSAGLETLLKASRRSASNGSHLELTRGKGHPADMFRLTALDLTLPLREPALCPAIQGLGSERSDRAGRPRSGGRSRLRHQARDDSNEPNMGERSLERPEARA